MDCIPRAILLLALMVPTIGFVRSGVFPQIVRVAATLDSVICVCFPIPQGMARWPLMNTREREEIACESYRIWRSARASAVLLDRDIDRTWILGLFPAAANDLLLSIALRHIFVLAGVSC